MKKSLEEPKLLSRNSTEAIGVTQKRYEDFN